MDRARSTRAPWTCECSKADVALVRPALHDSGLEDAYNCFM